MRKKIILHSNFDKSVGKNYRSRTVELLYTTVLVALYYAHKKPLEIQSNYINMLCDF